MIHYDTNRGKFSILLADASRIQLRMYDREPGGGEMRDLGGKYFCLMVHYGILLEQMFAFREYKPALLDGEAVPFCPYAPACVLTRALMEAYLAFFHLFIDLSDGEHADFRLKYWKTVGELQRLKLLQNIGSPAEAIAELTSANRTELEAIQQSPLFKKYKSFRAGRVGKLESDYAQSLKQMATAAGFKKSHFEAIYGDLSSHVHANSFAFAHYSISEPGNVEALMLMQRVLNYATMFLGFGMRDYCGLEKHYEDCFSEKSMQIVAECAREVEEYGGS
jgi:hypothetical protein